MKDLMSINQGSDFNESLRVVFAHLHPKKLIETGTYLGNGSTQIITSILKDFSYGSKFFSIESNPVYIDQARNNLISKELDGFVNLIYGLSIPRSMLPTKEQIRKKFVETKWPEGIYIDHPKDIRVERYFEETNSLAPDNRLVWTLNEFNYRPDFVLLDSGGHIGSIEFNILISSLRGSCVIALDDIYHVKHHESFNIVMKDPRFVPLVISKEKFGFCIARFEYGSN